MTSITAPLSDARAGPPAPTPAKLAAASTTRPAQLPASATLAAAGEITVELPEIPAGKLHLSLDEETGRVVGQVIDRNSGELLWQVPSHDMLRLIAATEKMLGPIYSTDA